MAENGKTVVPRYEFRAFARCFGSCAEILRSLASCEAIEERRDIYLVAATAKRWNVKIKEDRLSIKELLEEHGGLELWRPSLQKSFPAGADEVGRQVFHRLGVKPPSLPAREMSEHEFIHTVIVAHPQVGVGEAWKRRSRFRIGDCSAEEVDIVLNGAALCSMAVEGEDHRKVAEVVGELGLDIFENINYLKAMQKILGQVGPPGRTWLRQ